LLRHEDEVLQEKGGCSSANPLIVTAAQLHSAKHPFSQCVQGQIAAKFLTTLNEKAPIKIQRMFKYLRVFIWYHNTSSMQSLQLKKPKAKS
jgi:hypothetical protein